MCEGVEQDGPGTCPKCGMALEPAQPVVAIATRYTCPMHPEIVQDEPGSCPICGMALEPTTVSVEPEPNPEYVDFRRRFVIGAIFTVPLFVIAMGAHLFDMHALLPPRLSAWIQDRTIVVLGKSVSGLVDMGGRRIIKKKNRNTNE